MKLLLRYLRERYPAERYLPLAAALAYVSSIPTRALLPSTLAVWILLAGLRLRDDLADLPSDRRAHPRRQLSGVQLPQTLRALHVAAVAAALACALPLGAVGSWAGLPWLLGLVATLELAYGLKVPGKVHWVLLKYPGVLAVLHASVPTPSNPLFAATLVLASMLVFEWSDDARLQHHGLAPWVVALGSCATLAVASARLVQLGISAAGVAAIASTFCGAALWALSRRQGSSKGALPVISARKRLSLQCAVLALSVATCERLRGSHV